EIPDESAISDQDGYDGIEEDTFEEDPNQIPKRASLHESQKPASTLLEQRIREIIQSEFVNSALLEEVISKILRNFQKSNPINEVHPQSDTEDEEVIEDMEINFVRDKDAIDVLTVRGKIKRLVLSAITVDPGSNTLLMSRDIAERLGLKIDK
ncbi:9495_t:CDS:2, partial [Entrophospora sp. SA101]